MGKRKSRKNQRRLTQTRRNLMENEDELVELEKRLLSHDDMYNYEKTDVDDFEGMVMRCGGGPGGGEAGGEANSCRGAVKVKHCKEHKEIKGSSQEKLIAAIDCQMRDVDEDGFLTREEATKPASA